MAQNLGEKFNFSIRNTFTKWAKIIAKILFTLSCLKSKNYLHQFLLRIPMDDTDIASFYVVIQTIPNTISFIACIFLFGFYLTSKNKTLDKKMIFVLSVSDFFLHALTLSVIWIFPLIFTDDGEDGDDDDDENAGLETIINVFLIFPLHFSLFWMGSMSYILMKSLSFEQGSSSNDYSKTNLCVLTLPCTFLTIG